MQEAMEAFELAAFDASPGPRGASGAGLDASGTCSSWCCTHEVRIWAARSATSAARSCSRRWSTRSVRSRRSRCSRRRRRCVSRRSERV